MENEISLKLTIPETINLVTIFNLFVMFSILMLRKQNTRPNIILAFILILPAISYFNNYLTVSENLKVFPEMVYVGQLFAICIAPLIYHYTFIFMGRGKNIFNPLNIVSFLLIIICLFFAFKLFFADNEFKITFAGQITSFNFPRHLVGIKGVFFLLMNIYFIDASVHIWRFSIAQKNIFSGLEKIKLRYLQFFMVLIWLLNISILISYQVFPNKTVDFIAVPVITNVFYLFILITSFNHSAIFTKTELENFQSEFKINEKIKGPSANKKELPQEETKAIELKLSKLFNEHEIFTDPEINIVKLSENLGLTVHQTSYFINNHLKTNFFNLVNRYRIDMAKKELLNQGEKTEIEITGYQVGFNSKSAFYRAFNKFVGQSPSDFIKHHGKVIHPPL